MNLFTKKELVERLAELDIFETKAAAKTAVETISAIIIEQVAVGNQVNYSGLGKFYPYKLASGKIVPKFGASSLFKQVIPQ